MSLTVKKTVKSVIKKVSDQTVQRTLHEVDLHGQCPRKKKNFLAKQRTTASLTLAIDMKRSLAAYSLVKK